MTQKNNQEQEKVKIVITKKELKDIAYAFLNSYLHWKEKSRKTKNKIEIEIRTKIAEEEYKAYNKFLELSK
jgi:hypothetical protein